MSEQKTKDRVAAKLLMPVIATLASAVASYVAKKAPQFLEETVMPKLREAKDVAPAPGDVAHDLADRARSITGTDSGESGNGARMQRHSMDELERRRRERAEHRSARQKAS